MLQITQVWFVLDIMIISFGYTYLGVGREWEATTLDLIVGDILESVELKIELKGNFGFHRGMDAF